MGVISAILGILAIGAIALIHEVGHYFFAKRAGIKVLELSLGAGPKIVSFERKGTLYTIRPIPFLAYVRLEEEGEGGLKGAPIFKRLLLYIGGVFFNLLTAFFIISLIGMFSGIVSDKIVIGKIVEGTPAYEILKEKDQIIKVNDEPVSNNVELQEKLDEYGSSELQLTVKRNNEEIKLEITPQYDKENSRYVLGFFFAKEKLNPIASVSYSSRLIVDYVKETFIMLGGLVTGQVKANEGLVGIVGIVALSGDFTARFTDYMFFIAILSIGMAIINILPVPALDGGKIVLLGIEKLTGRSIDEKLELRLTIAGFALLIMLMVFTTVNDIFRLFGG